MGIDNVMVYDGRSKCPQQQNKTCMLFKRIAFHKKRKQNDNAFVRFYLQQMYF